MILDKKEKGQMFPVQSHEICAVVVTYNRLAMLCKCIEQIRNQNVPCDILVVNNASTDGTKDWLEQQSNQAEGMHVFHSSQNLGGAGGFHLGIKMAVEAGYAYVWVMDDDCMPRCDGLEQLMKMDKKLKGQYGWLSSRALWTDGTACRMNIQRRTPYQDIRDFDKPLIPAVMASFVSLLLPAVNVRTYGLPRKEFFIWADDWEYTRRISLKMPCYVVSESIVIHAMKQNSVVNIAKDTADRLERYRYAYRNDVYLYRREGVVGWVWIWMKNCYHSLLLIFSGHPNRIAVIWKGFCQGVRFKISEERM